MPRQRNLTAVLEFPLPSRLSRSFGIASGDDEEEEESCFICASVFCSHGTCPHTATQMPCCSQGLCCGCAVKFLKRCKCGDECDAVVAFCPFCREVMGGVGALDIYLGTRPLCKDCDAPQPQQSTNASHLPAVQEGTLETIQDPPDHGAPPEPTLTPAP